MLHASLIIHGSFKARMAKAEKLTGVELKPGPDILILNPHPSVKIKQVKELERFLSKKAVKLQAKIALLPKADQLTLPAQHAILKTLEEPPSHSIIILLAPNTSQLLDTIISRCQLIKLAITASLPALERKSQLKLFHTITNSNLSKRITLASKLGKSKQTALDFCSFQLLLLKPNINQNHQIIKNLLLSINRLKRNLNPKLVLESLLMHYPTIL